MLNPETGTDEYEDVNTTSQKTKRRRAVNKGHRLQRLIADMLRGDGAQVEMARNAVLWRRGRPGEQPRPFSVRHDIFGCWDMIVAQGGRRWFVQVTTLNNVSYKRAKIRAAGFPCTPDDRIYGHEKGRVFRELCGPDFAMPGRFVVAPPIGAAPVKAW